MRPVDPVGPARVTAPTPIERVTRRREREERPRDDAERRRRADADEPAEDDGLPHVDVRA